MVWAPLLGDTVLRRHVGQHDLRGSTHAVSGSRSTRVPETSKIGEPETGGGGREREGGAWTS